MVESKTLFPGFSSLARKVALAEKPENSPVIGVLDSFRCSGDVFSHGKAVEAVLYSGGLTNEQIQSYDIESGWTVSPNEVLQSKGALLKRKLSSYIDTTGASFLDCVSDALTDILTNRPSIQIVNISQSQSPYGLVTPFLDAVQSDPAFRTELWSSLEHEKGRGASCTPPAAVQSLLDFAQKESMTAPRIKASRSRYDTLTAEFHRRGGNIVISSGNTGRDARFMCEQGLTISPSLMRSFLVNPYVTVTGSIGKGGAPSSFTTLSEEVELFADGENIHLEPGGPTVSGTSFSAPLVAIRVLQERREYPGLSPQTLEERLKSGSL